MASEQGPGGSERASFTSIREACKELKGKFAHLKRGRRALYWAAEEAEATCERLQSSLADSDHEVQKGLSALQNYLRAAIEREELSRNHGKPGERATFATLVATQAMKLQHIHDRQESRKHVERLVQGAKSGILEGVTEARQALASEISGAVSETSATVTGIGRGLGQLRGSVESRLAGIEGRLQGEEEGHEACPICHESESERADTSGRGASELHERVDKLEGMLSEVMSRLESLPPEIEAHVNQLMPPAPATFDPSWECSHWPE